MRFQVNNGWLIGATLIPASTIIDYAGKTDAELSPCESIAKGKIPPLDTLALDYDAALVLWQNYPFHRDRLRRQLSPSQEAEFLRLREDVEMLQRYWPAGRG